MKKHYSISPDGEKFQLPDPDDYAKEFDWLKRIVRDQRNQRREIVVVMSSFGGIQTNREFSPTAMPYFRRELSW